MDESDKYEIPTIDGDDYGQEMEDIGDGINRISNSGKVI